MRHFILITNEIEYYALYLKSLIEQNESEFFPVLTTHPDTMGSLLTMHGFSWDIYRGKVGHAYMDLSLELYQYIKTKKFKEFESLIYKLFKQLKKYQLPKSYVVGVGSGSVLAGLRALAYGRQFFAVDCIHDISNTSFPEGAESFYIVSEEVDDNDIAVLHDNFEKFQGKKSIFLDLETVSFGFLHARNLEIMTFLDAKQRYYHAEAEISPQALLCDAFLNEPLTVPKDLIVPPYKELSKEFVERRNQVGILAITSHGMSDLVHLNNDYICGKSYFLNHEHHLIKGPLPSCMEEDEACFFKRDGIALSAYSIKARHIFMNSCGSLRFKNGDFDSIFNIAYSILEGKAESFIGAVRWKDGHGVENLLYLRLIKAGFSLGEIIYLLNKSLFFNQCEPSEGVFQLIGDPETRPYSKPDISPIEELNFGSNMVEIRSGFGVFQSTSEEVIEAYKKSLLIVKVSVKNFFVSVVLSDNSKILYIFIYGYEEQKVEAKVQIINFNDIFEFISRAYRRIEQNLSPSLGLAKLYPNKVLQGRKKNLDNRLLNISRLFKVSFTDNSSIHKLYKSCHKFLKEVDQIDFEIAEEMKNALVNHSFRFSEHYQKSFLLRPAETTGMCYICGEVLVDRYLEHIIKPSLYRIERICTNCGGIEDKPSSLLTLHILLKDKVCKKSIVKVKIKIVNDSEYGYKGYTLLAVRRSAKYNFKIDHSIQKIDIKARQHIEREFTMEIGDVSIHQYNLQAAFISNTDIFLAARSFWIQHQTLNRSE
ncbi:hypothetical protein [Bacillus stercoris]|uniref:Uncharacterized protein n=1 Tax=Bacillus stercoris TaxID=2054641 RepID=A0ABU0V7X3_9BACI|nr:hypothetical protein [Bacillus stercoris]MDQ1852679.1 hypothetical protein [Bacillus stercoris]